MMMIDGLQCGHFDRDVFSLLRDGGFACVTPTLGFWEDTTESMDSIVRWREMISENADLACIALTAADIENAAAEKKVAVLFGFQNSDLFQDRIGFVELFADMGVRVVQLTYNNQNELAGSCYEDHDSGLSRFGREVVREMNRVGMLVDLSHVGDRSTLDAIRWSEKPVAVTHANADSLFPHKRNKSDPVLAALRETGGVIGCAAYRNITPVDACSSARGWAEMVARTVDLAGIDHVGIGTDFSHNHTPADYDWMRKGRWTRSMQFGAGSAKNPGPAPKLDWLKSIDRLGTIAEVLQQTGFKQDEVARLMGGNWLRLYRDVLG